MSDSVRPHIRQPTRLPRPWDSPGKDTGVGCHFLLQYMKVKSESEVAQLCPTLSDPMDCSLPGSSVHGIFQARDWSGVPLPSPAYKLKFYIMAHLWEPCLAGNEQDAQIPLFSSQETPLPAHLWMTTERKRLTHPLRRLTRTRKCLTLLPPLSV